MDRPERKRKRREKRKAKHNAIKCSTCPKRAEKQIRVGFETIPFCVTCAQTVFGMIEQEVKNKKLGVQLIDATGENKSWENN